MKISNKKNKNTCECKKEIETSFFCNTNVKLNRFYSNISFHWKILIVILSSFIIGTLSLFLIKNTGLYSMGISSLTQGLSRIITASLLKNNVSNTIVSLVSDLTFWFFIVIVNIPLLFFSYKKIGKKFTILTIIYLLSSSIFSYSLNQIPGISNISLFGDVKSKESSLNQIVYLTWNGSDPSHIISLLMSGLCYSVFSTIFYAIIYILGASTAGGDIISIYWFKKKLKPLGKIIFMMNIFFLIFGYIIGSYISIGMLENYWEYRSLLGPNLICSIFMSIVFSYILNKLYPRYKVVSVKCYGKSVNKINNMLNDQNYIHNRTISDVTGSYSKEKIQIMEIYCFFYELHELISEIRKVDEKIFIAVNKEVEINGRMSFYKFIE